MKKASHTLIGLSGFWLVFQPHLQQLAVNHQTSTALFACMIGSIAPDFDIYASNMNLRFKERSLWNAHRGITHHAILGLLLFLTALIIPNTAFKAFVLGYILHLLADMLSKLGIPYWSYQDRFALKLYETGKLSEFLVLSAIIAFTAIIMHQII
ncbi:hypothetical protein DESAMIL20_668 [Desulfurella amilsii]|jgi:inner membrane protein|uniref:Metal-dependent hydrolase n=1 Tax=Desulfurella amilsii TaxID=1562698 RepID=A0A1X4XY98_9BACT|nr:metal-dependent hydrolase [Desulfurella amilsii]OSS42484.1 hypothetical protein DESAMIL20_668 [Desulfurella amilsii]